jgi:broad specificity phosphatase PhoE
MTRFDAATEATRKELFADAIRAHEERSSAFLTIEADVETGENQPPWVQFADGLVNLDCTDAELSRVKTLLDDYPEFRIDGLERPEDADGTNIRIVARTDPERVARFLDRIFAEVYERSTEYRAWVVAV